MRIFDGGQEGQSHSNGRFPENFVIQQLAAIAAQRFTELIITPFIDSIVGSITGGLSGGTAVETNARGGVYAGPGISAYSGSVVNRPTFFPFAKGTGLMGEAGPEAILPLDRDGSGRLGVRASGGGANASANQQSALMAIKAFMAATIKPLLDSMTGSGRDAKPPTAQYKASGTGGPPGISRIPAYSTIIERPTFFPMAKGTSVGMSDRAETEMPAALDGRGKLGSRAPGGGDFIVNISTPAGSKTSQTQRSEGNNRILDVVVEMVEGAIAGNVAQGRGPMADAMTSTYGLSRVAR